MKDSGEIFWYHFYNDTRTNKQKIICRTMTRNNNRLWAEWPVETFFAWKKHRSDNIEFRTGFFLIIDHNFKGSFCQLKLYGACVYRVITYSLLWWLFVQIKIFYLISISMFFEKYIKEMFSGISELTISDISNISN